MPASACTSPEEALGFLGEPVRRLVYGLGWKGFTPVQTSVIPALSGLDGSGGARILVSAPTGSGKTEAVFLPILSAIACDGPDSTTGIGALYIAPLKALVNDQFHRMGELCEALGIPVHRWHGDASSHAKSRMVERPSGILQITPESMESLLVNRTSTLSRVFGNLRWIVVDELHSFMGNPRGVHLRSLVHRLAGYSSVEPHIIGLSATMGDAVGAKAWMEPGNPDGVIAFNADAVGEGTRYAVFHRQQGVGSIDSPSLVGAAERVRSLANGRSALVFCATKSRVEELAQVIATICEPAAPGTDYMVHHGAMAPGERKAVEEALCRRDTAMHGVRVICTSTLELGVDIPALDLVVQLDDPPGVSAFVQRAGRSGRRRGEPRTIAVVTTGAESLVRTCAIVELFLKGWVEPMQPPWEPLDVVFHQVLSSVEETRGGKPDTVLGAIAGNPAFHCVRRSTLEDLIEWMVRAEYLTYLAGRDELILGPFGERLLRHRDFYSVFQGHHGYDVMEGERLVGEVPYGGGLGYKGSTFMLGGRAWRVQAVDHGARRLLVAPCEMGRVPVWAGNAEPPVHHGVATAMADLLCSDAALPYLDESATGVVESIRASRRLRGLGSLDRELVAVPGGGVRFDAFAGTMVLWTIAAMVRALGGDRLVPGPWGSLGCRVWTRDRPFASFLAEARERDFTGEELAETVDVGAEIPTKYGVHLPIWARQRLHASFCFDIPGALGFLRSVTVRGTD